MIRMQPASLWRHADFLKLWSGQTLSLLGTQFGALAFSFVAISTLHATAAQIGFLTAIRSVPWLLFGLFVGIGIDRFPRRQLLIVADLGRAILLGSIPIAFALGVLHLVQLYIVVFLTGTLSVVFESGYQSYLPALVEREHLVEGNSKLSLSESTSGIVGPSLAGILIQLISAPGGVAIDALSFLASAISIGLIRKREAAPLASRTQHFGAALREGFTFLRHQPLVRAFTGSNVTFMFFFTVAQTVLLIFLARDLNLAPSVIGLILMTGVTIQPEGRAAVAARRRSVRGR
jgi:hypothetical protein